MKHLFCSTLATFFLLWLATAALADIRIRQRVTMNGQTYETVTMIKGARERTEHQGVGAAAAMMSQVATITQCDLRRTVQLNDSKKLYFVEIFAAENNAGQNQTPVGGQTQKNARRGGTVTMTISITDTGERKTLFGLAARHLITVMEMESSPDSCGGAHKTKMEIDAWYVDFSADFNCPASARYDRPRGGAPDCRDRVVVKQTGKGKDGFLLNGTTRFFDENGKPMMTQTTETLELSTAPLAASLFEVPRDYKLVSASNDLYSMADMADLMRQRDDAEPNREQAGQTDAAEKTVGVNVKLASGVAADQSEINMYLAAKLRENAFKTRAGATSGVDYVLTVEIAKLKESTGGKIGGLFGKVTGTDVKAGKTEIEMTVTLARAGAPAAQSRVAKKFDGNATDAVRAALDEALEKILGEIEN